jgi:PAS domain S-box-containing protein
MFIKKLLLADANPKNIRLIRQTFKNHPGEYDLSICGTHDEIFSYLNRNQQFDLLIINLIKGDDSAADLLKHPRIHNTIPVIFICERNDINKGVELLQSGAIDCFHGNSGNLKNIVTIVERALREWNHIKARIKAETLLFETENRYRTIIKNTNDVVWEFNVNAEKFTFISESVHQFLGYKIPEFLELNPFTIIHPESFVTLQEEFSKMRKTRETQHPNHIHFFKDLKFFHKDGSIRWGEVRAFIITEPDHSVSGISGIVRNITAQKRTIRKLEIREAFFETLIKEAPLAIVILDNNDRIKQVNTHFTGLFGYTEEECIDQYINELIVPPDLVHESQMLTTMASRGEYVDQESVRCHKSGKRIDVHILGKPVILKDDKLGVFGIYQDITHRKKAEIANRVARIKQQFLANMSHEIRTPLTGIIGMIDLLSVSDLNKQQSFYVDVIKKSSDGLLDIVNDILDLSKIEAGKMMVRPCDFELKKSAETLFNLFNALTRKKDIGFILEYDDKLPEYVCADENRISQIITNLLSNAAKFTSEGCIKLSYKWLGKENGKHIITISVTDTGIGISPEDREKLFQIFTQIDSSDTRNYEGAGLGLSISHKLAELMYGRIDVSSTPGKGSCFSLTIPLSESDYVSHSLNYPAEENQDKISGTNVLLTEDKRTNQLVISLMLKELGCTVDLASNGAEAIEKLKNNKYDIIFMDIQMPVMDGLTAVRKMHRDFKPWQLPYIIGLSAKAMEGDAEFYIAEGMDDYLSKPVTTEDLRNSIVKWLHKRKV